PRLDDLLAQIVRVAAPVVMQLLGHQNQNQGQTQSQGGGGLGPLVQAIVGALPGLVGQLSVDDPDPGGNRFAESMIFGIGDALLGSVIGQVAGPLLQVLPQLVNSANQQRLQMEESRNKLVSGIVDEVQKRLLLEQIQQAQQQAPAPQAADLQRLAALLQQAQ